jgi:hypothetical protein
MTKDKPQSGHRAPPLTAEQQHQLRKAKEAVARAKTSVLMFRMMMDGIKAARDRLRRKDDESA